MDLLNHPSRSSTSVLPTERSRRGLRALGALALAGSALLSGCAAMKSLTSDVSSYGNWPAGRAPGRYVFDRLPSQQADVATQDKVEAAAEPALAAAGFAKVADASQADVTVQVSAHVQTLPPRYADRPGPLFYPNVGGWWGSGGWGGFSLGIMIEPSLNQVQVDVLVRDRQSGQVLYETHAVREQNTGYVDKVLAPMFSAALKEFPQAAAGPKVVTVPLAP